MVLVDNYFSLDELEPVKKDIENLVDFLAGRLHAEGKLTSMYFLAIPFFLFSQTPIRLTCIDI